MEVIALGRGEGKTLALIKESAKTGAYILVEDIKRASELFHRAKDMGYQISFPITAGAAKFPNHYLDHILVDDAEAVLQYLLKGVTIDAMTITPTVTKIDRRRKS